MADVPRCHGSPNEISKEVRELAGRSKRASLAIPRRVRRLFTQPFPRRTIQSCRLCRNFVVHVADCISMMQHDRAQPPLEASARRARCAEDQLASPCRIRESERNRTIMGPETNTRHLRRCFGSRQSQMVGTWFRTNGRVLKSAVLMVGASVRRSVIRQNSSAIR